jgi:hypothetical protein
MPVSRDGFQERRRTAATDGVAAVFEPDRTVGGRDIAIGNAR